MLGVPAEVARGRGLGEDAAELGGERGALGVGGVAV